MGHEIEEERARKESLQTEEDRLQEESKGVMDFLPHRNKPGLLKRARSDDSPQPETKRRKSNAGSFELKKTPEYQFRTTAG